MLKRVYSERKAGLREDAAQVKDEISSFLRIPVTYVRLLTCCEIDGISEDDFRLCAREVFTDRDCNYFDGITQTNDGDFIFCAAPLSGQYDERGDKTKQLIEAVLYGKNPASQASSAYTNKIAVTCFDVFIIGGKLTNEEKARIKSYYINPADSYELILCCDVKTPGCAEARVSAELGKEPRGSISTNGFINMSIDEIKAFHAEAELAMGFNDLLLIHAYFKEDENRDPTITEIRVLDTYWSDHCRHTTFLTRIDSVAFENGPYEELFRKAYELYLEKRSALCVKEPISLMDLATIGMKSLKAEGKLPALDESGETNACSINIKADANGQEEDWLLMFKNETHNHPTEIEPFGGAATCLGGAIREPLAGRSFVFQSMRITGSADPRRSHDETIPGKLSQRKITQTAAKGYSSYGNETGVPTGLISEIYHDGYAAKRMELSMVIGAVKKENIKRREPVAGDYVLLVGGRTGRDGIGAATGSSREQGKNAYQTYAAHAQKGCPSTERNIMRLFRRADVSGLIKRCNDFGAGGVAVAAGGLADGLIITLDNMPAKYEGLDGTELAVSESQERMAVVVSPQDEQTFITAANNENLECARIAVITDKKRLVMKWRDEIICDISRAFLKTSGVSQYEDAGVFISSPKKREVPVVSDAVYLLPVLSDVNVASQKGLIEEFFQGPAVLSPQGGLGQFTPAQAMAAKIPVENAATNTAAVSAYGYDPYLSELSPFHGAVCAVADSIAKVIAAGADKDSIHLSFQEYFERLGKNESKWGKPFAALLGGFYAQMALGFASVGGKDSMSGSYGDIGVPPALISFAVATAKASNIISPEFKAAGNEIAVLETPVNSDGIIDMNMFLSHISLVEKLIKEKKIISAYALGVGGVAAAVSKMSFGNFVGVKIDYPDLYSKKYGSFIVESIPGTAAANHLTIIGKTVNSFDLVINGQKTELSVALAAWLSSLECVFPTNYFSKPPEYDYSLIAKNNYHIRNATSKTSAPEIFIPILPGTNGDYDLRARFEELGGRTNAFVINTLCPQRREGSISEAARHIKESRILALPAGGDLRLISAFLTADAIKEAVNVLLNKNDGLVLGIAEGFAALLRAGLIGENMWESSDITLTHNEINRYVSSFARVKVISNNTPWLNGAQSGEAYLLPICTDRGRLYAKDSQIKRLSANGQAAMQFVDFLGDPKADIRYNPTGSAYALCALTSACGRILGITGRPELASQETHKNIPGNKNLRIFESGIGYYRSY